MLAAELFGETLLAIIGEIYIRQAGIHYRNFLKARMLASEPFGETLLAIIGEIYVRQAGIHHRNFLKSLTFSIRLIYFPGASHSSPYVLLKFAQCDRPALHADGYPNSPTQLQVLREACGPPHAGLLRWEGKKAKMSAELKSVK
eukprot:gene10984-17755_t